MRRVLVSLLLIAGCKAGDVTTDPNGLAKPVEMEQPAGGVPIPGEGAASPTTPADPADTPSPAGTVDPSTTPAAGPDQPLTDEAPAADSDPWSNDPWAPATTKDEVTASPALPEATPAAPTDPWAPTSTDPWAPTQDAKPKKRVPAPIR